MAHAYVANRVHVVFTTKGRRRLILPEVQPRLWKYFAGIGERKGIPVFTAGGIDDHVHLLISLPAKIALAEAVSKLKANSSRWLGEHGIEFSWQEGYGAFSVSASQTNTLRRYIERQREHHHKHSFESEFRSLVQRYGLTFYADEFE